MSVTARVSDRVGQNDTMGPFIERFSDISEALLTCSIPDIKGDLTTFDFNSFYFKVYTNCTEIVRLK
jgi:hypothetical protein